MCVCVCVFVCVFVCVCCDCFTLNDVEPIQFCAQNLF